MENQGDQMDFQSVRAMFQEKECVLGQPKNKPVVLEKPKVAPPPQSPTYLPAGARPSLLSTMNQALEAKTMNAPRVIFKDEKKESKKPLIQTTLKGREKSDKKVKESKDKTAKEDKEKLLDPSNQKEKKGDGKDKKFLTHKEPTAELVQASPPPKATTQKKKGFSGFKKGTKRDSTGISVDPILDTPSVANSGPAPLIPVPSDTGNMLMEPLYSIPKARPLSKMIPPSQTTEPPDCSPPLAINPDVPNLRGPTQQSKTSAETQNHALPLSSLASHSEFSDPPSVAPAPSNHDSRPPPPAASPTRPTIAPPAPPNQNTHTPPTVAVLASSNHKTSTPPNVAAPVLQNRDSSPPPPVASPTRPTIAPPAPPNQDTPITPTVGAHAPLNRKSSIPPTFAPPAPPNQVTHTPPAIASPVPLNQDTPIPPTVAAPAPPNRKSSIPPTFAPPAPPNQDTPIPPAIASPVPLNQDTPIPPAIASPVPLNQDTSIPPAIASPVPLNQDTPIPPTVAAPAPPNRKSNIPPTVAAPAPPNRTSSISPTVASPAPPNHNTPTPQTVAASAPPKHKTPNPPTIAAPSNVNASIPPHLAVPVLAAPTPPNSDTPNHPLSASPAPLNAASPVPDPLLSATPDPSSGLVHSDPLPVVSALSPSPPELQIATEANKDAVKEAAVEKPHSPETDSHSSQSSKGERPISALSVLERAEDKTLGKKTPPGDQRILNALENARKKSASPLLSSPQSYSVTPPPEEPPSQESPTYGLPELPPIDYEGGTRASPKPVNGTDHQETSPIWERMKKEKSDGVPELLVVPHPPPKQELPDLKYPDPAPKKPDRPLSDSLNEFIPPPPLFKEGSEVFEVETKDDPEFEELASDTYSPELPSPGWGNELNADVSDGQNQLEYYSNGIADPESEVHSEPVNEDDYEESPAPVSALPVSQDPPQMDEPDNRHSVYEETENMYEDISVSPSKKKKKGNSDKKHRGSLKNPYVESTQETVQEKPKIGRFGKSEKKPAAEKSNEKELKKKEKQRLEKEKKDQKEKMERDKKEQKEREKKENEMKKKFKITGQEEAMYQAKVTETTKGSKKNLPVKCGDIVSIIRTNNCPKGMWLARDSKNHYGYVPVNHVNLDIKEMLEMGKKAIRNSAIMEPENTSQGQWAPNHTQTATESFTDDSEEWSGDEDDTLSPAPETDQLVSGSHNRTFSMPDMGNKDLSINHQHSRSDMCDSSQTQARQEALQKLATFLQSPKPADPTPSDPEPEMSPVLEQEAVSEPENSSQQEADFDPTAVILPPPDQYADTSL